MVRIICELVMSKSLHWICLHGCFHLKETVAICKYSEPGSYELMKESMNRRFLHPPRTPWKLWGISYLQVATDNPQILSKHI